MKDPIKVDTPQKSFDFDIKRNLNEMVFKTNPIFTLALSLTPVLIFTKDLNQSVVISIILLIILTLATIIFSIVNKFIPENMKNITWLILFAFLITFSEIILQVIDLTMYETLGIYVPLLSLSGLILYQALVKNLENNIVKDTLRASIFGFSFMLSMIVISIVRSVITTGAVRLFGIQMRLFDVVYSFTLLDSAFGAFVLLGLLLGFFRSKITRGEQS